MPSYEYLYLLPKHHIQMLALRKNENDKTGNISVDGGLQSVVSEGKPTVGGRGIGNRDTRTADTYILG